MLSLQAVVGLQALLHLLEAPGLGLQALGVAAQLGAEVLGLDAQPGEASHQLVELGIDPRHAGSELFCGRERLGRAPLPRLGGEGLGPAAGGGEQAVHPAQALAFAEQSRLLVLAGVEGIDLLDLEGEQVQVAVAAAGALAQLGQATVQLARAGVSGRELIAQGQSVAPAEAVEQLELRRGQGEAPMLVLAEEGHEAAAERGQIGSRGRTPADERARAPVLPHPPGQRQLVAVVSDQVGQVGQLGLLQQPGRQLEHALDVGLGGARADDSGPGLATKQQVERVREHGLAGARLAGDRREPAAGAKLGPLDQEQVLDAQLEEHRSGVPVRPDGAAEN